jgi:enediyne biosynthesis protein E4
LLSLDQLVKQIPSLRRNFLRYDSYKNVKLENIIDKGVQEKFVHKDVYTFASVFLKNRGDGHFLITNLPHEAQMFPIFSICIDDIDDDGVSDILTVGNLDAVQPDFGRYDAGYGLVLMGDQSSNFTPLPLQRSGFVVKGQGRDIKSIITSKTKNKSFLVSRNNDTVKLFKKTKN